MLILIVEDDPILSLHLEAILTDAGHKIAGPAATSVIAHDIAARDRPDLALIDINLVDGKTGARLADRLNTDFQLPVVFMSGDLEEANRARHAAIGILAKPYLSSDVVPCIELAARIMGHGQRMTVPDGFEVFSV